MAKSYDQSQTPDQLTENIKTNMLSGLKNKLQIQMNIVRNNQKSPP